MEKFLTLNYFCNTNNLCMKLVKLLSMLLLLIASITLSQSITACTDHKISSKKEPSQKISSSLLNVVEYLESPSPKEGQLAPYSKAVRIDKEGKIQIYIKLKEISETKLDALKKHGVKIDIYDKTEKLVQGWALPNQIKTISELPFVKFVDLPTYGVTN